MDKIVFEFVDKILDKVKDDEELLKEYVFDFLTAFAINNKLELFMKYQKHWESVYETSFGKTSIELAQKLIERIKGSDNNEE